MEQFQDHKPELEDILKKNNWSDKDLVSSMFYHLMTAGPRLMDSKGNIVISKDLQEHRNKSADKLSYENFIKKEKNDAIKSNSVAEKLQKYFETDMDDKKIYNLLKTVYYNPELFDDHKEPGQIIRMINERIITVLMSVYTDFAYTHSTTLCFVGLTNEENEQDAIYNQDDAQYNQKIRIAQAEIAAIERFGEKSGKETVLQPILLSYINVEGSKSHSEEEKLIAGLRKFKNNYEQTLVEAYNHQPTNVEIFCPRTGNASSRNDKAKYDVQDTQRDLGINNMMSGEVIPFRVVDAYTKKIIPFKPKK